MGKIVSAPPHTPRLRLRPGGAAIGASLPPRCCIVAEGPRKKARVIRVRGENCRASGERLRRRPDRDSSFKEDKAHGAP